MSGYGEGMPGSNMSYHSQHRPQIQARVSPHCCALFAKETENIRTKIRLSICRMIIDP